MTPRSFTHWGIRLGAAFLAAAATYIAVVMYRGTTDEHVDHPEEWSDDDEAMRGRSP